MSDCEKQKQEVDPDFLVDLHFHDLRHEAISRLFEMGLDAMTVSEIRGHKTLSQLKRYTHLSKQDLAQKLAKLEALHVRNAIQIAL